jgi:hypothetical protein
VTETPEPVVKKASKGSIDRGECSDYFLIKNGYILSKLKRTERGKNRSKE